jgi:hypothetical protein
MINVLKNLLMAPAIFLDYVVSIRFTSRLELVRQLRRRGIYTESIPKPCLQELADNVVFTGMQVAELTRRSWRETVSDHLKNASLTIANIIDGIYKDDPLSREHTLQFIAILHKYQVRTKNSPPVAKPLK